MIKTSAFVLFPGFSKLGLDAVSTAFTYCNSWSGDPFYSMSYHSVDGSAVVGINGRAESVEGSYQSFQGYPDYLFLCGGATAEMDADLDYLGWLNNCYRHGSCVVGISVPSCGLAEAGLLNHRRVSVHWRAVGVFQAAFPKVDVRKSYFEIDGRVLTCSGGISAVDLITHLIARDHGKALADLIANEVQHGRIRSESDLQRGALPGAGTTLCDTLADAVEIIENSVDKKLTVDAVSQSLGVSGRQLHRLFKKEFGVGPHDMILGARLRRSRQSLHTTSQTLAAISEEYGFSSPSYFSQCYKRVYGVTPSKDRVALKNWALDPDPPESGSS